MFLLQELGGVVCPPHFNFPHKAFPLFYYPPLGFRSTSWSRGLTDWILPSTAIRSIDGTDRAAQVSFVL